MSDFIAANLHKKVDHIMDVFFGAGVASHPTIIEQINYLLFMRALSQNDDDLRKIGVIDAEQLVFDGDLEKYRWDNLLTLNAEQLFVALEECFRKIPESTTNKTVRLVFRNAHIKLFDKPTLRTVLHEIDAFAKLMDEGEHEGKRDIFGDTYEYLLSKLAQAGTSGQFRTPRHIIEFLVDVVAPKKGETIIDPAVGTAGFLVKAFEYLRREYTSPEQLASGGAFDQLNSKEHTFLYEHTFSGFDSDEDMIKFGMMNLYLHGLQNARMVRQNTLTDTAGSRDKYDVILANPPFSGKIDRDSVAEELQMNTGATEVLFLRYMLRHLTDNGRAGVIVPEGILFNASGAHTKIREMLLENGLWCVTSLPGGVFNPYAGVKTSILFFDKTRTDKAEVLFAKVEHDGFSLSAQRKPIAKNDLPQILSDIERYKNGKELQQLNAHVVSYDRIKATTDSNMNGDRYKLLDELTDSQRYPTVELSELCRLQRGLSYRSVELGDKNNGVPFYNLKSIKRTGTVQAKDFKYFTGTVKEQHYVKKNDLLIALTDLTPTSELIGSPKLIDDNEDAAYSADLAKVIFLDERINPIYLYHTLRQDAYRKYIVTYSHGANVKHLQSEGFLKYRIQLPPMKIQQRIIDEIENKQSAIDHARAIISTLERERELILTQALAPSKKTGR
jgi:type I restriction enzyme M protein